MSMSPPPPLPYFVALKFGEIPDHHIVTMDLYRVLVVGVCDRAVCYHKLSTSAIAKCQIAKFAKPLAKSYRVIRDRPISFRGALLFP